MSPADEQAPPRHPRGYDAERHRREYLSRGTYVFRRAQPAADRGHDRLVGRRDPQVEPDQHLQLPPAGGGHHPAQELAYALSTAIAVSTPCATQAGPPERFPDVVARISFFVNAGLRFVEECARCARSPRSGTDRGRAASMTAQAQAALRGAGQLAGPDGGPAGEQRAAHRAGDARRHALPRRGRARSTSGVERGARPAAAVGPAVGAARTGAGHETDLLEYEDLSRAPAWSRRRSPSWWRPPVRRSTAWRRAAARSRPSSPGT